MADKARLIDIARALNISTTTVSRALNNKSDISPKTKEAVLKLARELDYHPNSLAISLRKKQSLKSIGVVLPDVGHYFFSTVLKGIMKKAHLENYVVMVGESGENPDREEQIVEEFINYGVSGIIITPGRKSNHESLTGLLESKRVPLVLLDRTFPNYHGSFVLSNDFQGAVLATDHLLESGYRRIAHIGSLNKCSVGNQRYEGYLAALKKRGLRISKKLIKECETTTLIGGFNAAKDLFDLATPPDAIFTVTDDVAAGVLEFCADHGIRVPETLGVVGFSNSEISSILKPKLTTVEQKGEQMGEVAFEFFISSLNKQSELKQKTFDSKLIVRESSIR